MIGDMVSSTMLTLLVIPAVYGLIKGWRLPSKYVPLSGNGFERSAISEAAE